MDLRPAGRGILLADRFGKESPPGLPNTLTSLPFRGVTMSSQKQCLKSDRIPPAVGPYSQAVRYGDLLFCSGMIPLDPETRKVVAGGIAEQTRQVLDNLTRLLEDCGSSAAQVLKTTVFLKNMEHFAEFNAIYAEYFAQEPPARSTVQVARLPLDVLIEVEAIASV